MLGTCAAAGCEKNIVKIQQYGIQLTLDGITQTRKRKSYHREEQLKVVKFYFDNEKNLYQTCNKFSLNSKNVLRWIKDKEKIRKSGKGSKRILFTK